MPDEESYLNESLRKIAKGAGIGFTGTFIGMAFGYFSRIVIARFSVLAQNLVSSTIGFQDLRFAVMTIGAICSLVVSPVCFYISKVNINTY